MTKTILLIFSAMVLILDSHAAAASASHAIELCIRTLIPGLFPLLVVSAMLVPGLKQIRIPWLARLLGFPEGSEGLFLLGCAGGFPVGAACVSQAVHSGTLDRRNAGRMLGLVSFCGPGFLFGIIGPMLGPEKAVLLFLIQLETGLLIASLWPRFGGISTKDIAEAVCLPEAVKRGLHSMATVCAWVILASVTAGIAQRWVLPLLPDMVGYLFTGLLELTTGVFAIGGLSAELQFWMCAVFLSFGGISVLLQISSLAASAGLGMKTCAIQKAMQALFAGVLAAAYLVWGWPALLIPIFVKTVLEFPGLMVYNAERKEGI